MSLYSKMLRVKQLLYCITFGLGIISFNMHGKTNNNLSYFYLCTVQVNIFSEDLNLALLARLTKQTNK